MKNIFYVNCFSSLKMIMSFGSYFFLTVNRSKQSQIFTCFLFFTRFKTGYQLSKICGILYKISEKSKKKSLRAAGNGSFIFFLFSCSFLRFSLNIYESCSLRIHFEWFPVRIFCLLIYFRNVYT